MADLAHTQRLAIWAEHGQPNGYGGSDMMREDVTAMLAEVERMAEMLYRLHVAPASAVSPSQAQSETPDAWLRKDGMKAMPADEKEAWKDAGHPDIVEDYTVPLYRAAGIQSPAAPVGALVCLACGGDVTGGKCKNRRCICGPIVEEVEAAPVGGEVPYKCSVCGEGCNGCGKAGCPEGGNTPYDEGPFTIDTAVEAQPQPSEGVKEVDPDLLALARQARENARTDSRTEAEKIKDAVKWVLDPDGPAQPQPSDQGEKNSLPPMGGGKGGKQE